MEDKILEEVRKLINNNVYEADQNFFEAGGTSMQIIELARIIYETTGKELDMTEFFSNPYINKISFVEDNSLDIDEKKKPKILFIHDGSGFSDSYRHFYSLLSDDYVIERIDFPNEKKELTPQRIDVVELTKEYLNSIDDKDNIKYIFGWCIGGKIAYEMAKHLNNVEKVIMMNSPAPNVGNGNDFTLESEKSFIKENFKIPFFNLINTNTMTDLWEKVIEYYTKHTKIFQVVKNLTPAYIKFLIPNYYSDKNTPEHYIRHLNLIRSFSVAHGLYKTTGMVSGPKFYFFNAENENQDKDNLWENYVSDGKSYNLPGIHTDIVNKDNTETIINLINK